MSKIERKRAKILARIEELEEEMRQELKQKTSNTPEISVNKYIMQIEALRSLLKDLK